MNTEQINYIVKVAETGSISISADKLYVTQAAISKSISNLEKELGVKLFRSRGTVLLLPCSFQTDLIVE